MAPKNALQSNSPYGSTGVAVINDLASYQGFLGIQTYDLHTRRTDRAALQALIALRSPLAAALAPSAWTTLQIQLTVSANELAATEAYRPATTKLDRPTLAPVLSTLTAEADHHVQMALDELQRDPAQFAGKYWDNWQEKLSQPQWRMFVDAIYARYLLLNLPHSLAQARHAAQVVAAGNVDVIAEQLQHGLRTPSQMTVKLATVDAAKQFTESRKA